MTALPQLARKISMAIAGQRGIRICADELDLLVEIGANDVLQQAAADYQRDECQRRNEQRRSISAANTNSTGTADETEALEALSSPSSGMTQRPDASEAFQRARRMATLPSGSSTRITSKRKPANRSAQRADRSAA